MIKVLKFVLAFLLVLVISLLVIAWFFGIRMPGAVMDPNDVSYEYSDSYLSIEGDGIYFQKSENGIAYFRAYAPNVSVVVDFKKDNLDDYFSKQGAIKSIQLSNIHNEAVATGSLLQSEIDNLQRNLDIAKSLKELHDQSSANIDSSNITVTAEIPFPKQSNYTFASTGDTGGAEELYWGIYRAKELGADFVLHVGDINYQEIDFEVLPDVLAKSPLPIYMTIGNHEFHTDGELLYLYFSDNIGPLNSTFVLGNIRFVNIDTAVDTYFYNRGNRGKMLKRITQLEKENKSDKLLILTHRPLTEPLFLSHPDKTGEKKLGYLGESSWLRKTMLKLGTTAWIAGDVHIAYEFDDKGMMTYLVGEGMGQQDLLSGTKMSRILMSEVTEGQPIEYQWESLNLPDNAYCNDRTLNRLGKVKITSIAKRVKRAHELCDQSDVYQFMKEYP